MVAEQLPYILEYIFGEFGILADSIFLIYIISIPFIPDKAIKAELGREKNIETQIKTNSAQIEKINKIWLHL